MAKKIRVPEGLPEAPDLREDPRNQVMRDLAFPLITEERSVQNFEKRFWRGGYNIDGDGKWIVIYCDLPERFKNGADHVASVFSRLSFYQELPADGAKLSGWTTNLLRQAVELEFFDAAGQPIEAEIVLTDEREDDLPAGYVLPEIGQKLGYIKFRITLVAEERIFEEGNEKKPEVVIYFKGGEFGKTGDPPNSVEAGAS